MDGVVGVDGMDGWVVRVDEVVVLVEVDWLKKLNVTPKESQVS